MLREIESRRQNFNPRSLTGATADQQPWPYVVGISIHAPLRERPMAGWG